MAHVKRLSIDGNPNVGLYAFATDSFCLVGAGMGETNKSALAEALDVPIHEVSIAGTPLIGVFVSGSDKHLLVPSIIFDQEKESLDALGIPYTIIESTQTALGNNVAVGKDSVFVNPDFEQRAKDVISEALDLPLIEQVVKDQSTVGSCLVLTTRGGVVHRDASDEQIDQIAQDAGVPVEVATVNRGVVQVGSGLIANKNGFIVGDHTTGVEITNIDEILGFLDEQNE